MSCFPCFTSQRSKKSGSNHDPNGLSSKASAKDKANHGEDKHINAQTFTFRELATATKNFRQECLLGEGGFGRVYKGTIKTSGLVVAVKQLDRNGMTHGNKEFLSEVLTLSLLHHPNLVNLIGYCADGDQRLLVFEYMSGGSLEDHLLDIRPDKNPLDWFTRVKIALGIATGLEYLHETASPPVIYRDLKASNILLDDDLNPKLSDFGGGKLGPPGEKAHVSSRVMGTYGYSAPEYTRTGQLTLKSDIYSYGVVLLELVTGRRAIDTTRPNDEQNLVSWAQPFFRDPKKFPDLADPLLDGQFPEKDLNQAVAIAAMCLQDEATARPLISDVVMTLSFLSTKPAEFVPAPAPAPASKDGEKLNSESSKHRDADKDHESETETSGEEDDQDEEEDGESPENEGSESSDYEDVKSGEESQRTASESKKWRRARSSSHRRGGGGSGSSVGSRDESAYSSQKTSSGSEDGSVSSGVKQSSRRSVSSRESCSGSNRPDSPERVQEEEEEEEEEDDEERALRRSSTKGSTTNSEAFTLSRRTTRRFSSRAVSERSGGNLSVRLNSSELSPERMSACYEHGFSFGSQDGFVSLQNITSMESSDGSVHSRH